MPDPPNPPEPVQPVAPRRVVADWEYKTAYDQGFQVRVTPALHERLCQWAKRDRRSVNYLVIEILEEAVQRRSGRQG